MKKIYPVLTLVLLSIPAIGIVFSPMARAGEGTCFLQATDKDVFVIVYDMDGDGNRGAKIWQGRINANESVKLTTPHARFVYDYNAQPDVDQPLSGGDDRWCSGGETILVP